MPFLDPPAPAIPLDAFEGLLDGDNRKGGQQQPLYGGGALGGMSLPDQNRPQFEGRQVAGPRLLGRTHRHLFEAKLDPCIPKLLVV